MKTFSKTELEKELIQITQQLLKESGETSRREIKLKLSLHQHLGIDSLGRAELFRRIEKKLLVSLPDQLLAEVATLEDILNYLSVHQAQILNDQQTLSSPIENNYEALDLSHAQTLMDVLLMYAKNQTQKVHIYFQQEDGTEVAITYGELLEKALRVANALKQKGLKESETVAIMQPTGPQFFYAFFGVLFAGGIPVPIYPPFRAHLLDVYAKTEAHILRNAEVRMLLTFDRAEKLSLLLKNLVPSLKQVTTVDALLTAEPLTNYFEATGSEFAFIQYTSGSTSDPKGVLLSHDNLLSNIRAYGQAVEIKSDDVAVSWLPLYHDMGLIGMWLGSLYLGIPLVLLTPFSFLNHPEKWLWAIHRYRGTHSGAPNFAYELCVRKIEPHMIEGLDLSSWRMAANGAEKVYPRTLDEFIKKFAPYGFKAESLMPVYGLAESSVGLAIPPMGRKYKLDHIDRLEFESHEKAIPTTDTNGLDFVSVGKPLIGHDVQIVDENYHVLPERHVGRLQFRGPSRMQAYYRNPRATEAVLHEGWIDSGDLAYIADGEIFITGRRKDLIIKAGRNLYPAEIEEIVGRIPKIRQGCVVAFGVTQQEKGTEAIVIVAETKIKNKKQQDDLRQQIITSVVEALDMTPDHIVFVAPRTIPKTSSGKLQRARCKQHYLQGKINKQSLPAWIQIIQLTAQAFSARIKQLFIFGAKFCYSFYIALMTILGLVPVMIAACFASSQTTARTLKFWAKFLVNASFVPVHYEGLQHLTEKQPVIYCANHASYVDVILLLSLLPSETKLVGKKELLKIPLINLLIKKLGHLTLDRVDLSKGIEETKTIEQALKKGYSVLIFPEGTFSYASGLRPFRLGAFKIAVETNKAICPIALSGTRSILRGNEKLLSPARVDVTVMQPFNANGNEWKDVVALRDRTRDAISKYCGEVSLDYIAALTVAQDPDKSS